VNKVLELGAHYVTRTPLIHLAIMNYNMYPLHKPLPLADFFCDGTDVENLRSYKPGGFHPVHLGDTFSMCPGSDRPRYRVLQKLGQGAFSTVWLAQDMADHEYVIFAKHLCGAE
jgi:serine/threonine protein kinase